MPRAAVTILTLGCAAGTLSAQEPARAALRGVVVAESGERIALAVVLLTPGFGQRFAADDGAFVFTGVAPGVHRLLVRQVGFIPFDSAITVSPATPPLRIMLRRVAVQLAAIIVESTPRCLQPGPPDSAADPDLAAVFEQLRLNAERHQLLLDQYPFRYTMTRQLSDIRRDGGERTRTDTLTLRSNSRWAYTPGRVVTDDPTAGRTGVRNVHLPVLADIADSTFQDSHCFRLAGLDSLEGRSLVRLDFQAAESLRDPDVDGSAYLDPVSYQVRRTSVTLTRLNRAAAGVTSWVATATFRELRPNLIVVEQMSARTALQPPGRAPWTIVGRSELQRFTQVEFDSQLP
jgi:hypothetical protein